MMRTRLQTVNRVVNLRSQLDGPTGRNTDRHMK